MMMTTINRSFRARLVVSGLLVCMVMAARAQEEKGAVFPDDYPVLHPQFRKWPSPAMDDSVSSAGPVLCWPAVKKKGVTYDVRFSKDSSFSRADGSVDIPWTVFPVSRVLDSGRWYWQYRVHGGRWSAIERFRVPTGASTHVAPPADKFLAGVPAAHPRVLIDPREVGEFAAAVKGGADAAVILKKATKMLDVAIPEETAGASARKGRNEDESRKLALEASKVGSYKVYAAVDLFCKAWLISGDERYAAKAVSWGIAVAGWDPDGVSKLNDFGDARCMLSMALVFDNFHDRLSAEQRMVLLKSIRVRADRFYREWINNIDAKVLSNHVWQYILHYFMETAVAVYGEIDEARDWLRYGYELWLARAPVLGGGDGGWQEGTSYFRINMETLLGMPLMIRDYTGYDFLQGNEWYRRNPYWMAYSFPAGSSSAGFGDDVEKHFSPGPDYLAYADALSRLTGSRMAAWYAGRIEKIEHLRLADADMLRWVRMRYLRGLPRPAPIAADSLPEAMVFAGTGVADMHSDMMDRDKDLMVSFRSSPYGSYGHLLADQNTFNVLFGGQRLFYMSGHKVAMQDPHRLQWYKATKGHNGILIDGQGQPFNVEAYGYIKRFLNNNDISYVMGDASQAYSSKAEKVQTGLKKFYRHVLLLRPDILLVYDELEADHPAEWSWLIHSPGRIILDTVGGTFHCSIKNASAGGALFSPQPVRWALSDTFGVPAENWVGRTDEDGNLIEYKNDSWHLTATTAGKVARMRWLAVMRVCPGAKAELLPLAMDAGGRLTVEGWTIHAELDAARPAELDVSNGKRGVAFTTEGQQAKDMVPAELREIPVSGLLKHDAGRGDATQRGRRLGPRRPNILFAIADDQSFPYASAYGTTGVRTPAFDRVAAAGVLFNNAFAAAPQCSPSRAAILTGRNIWQLEEAGTHSSLFPRKFTVFTDVLEKSGYTIGYTGKPWAPGNWKDAGWPRNPVGPEYNTKRLAPPATGISKTDYFGNFVDFYEHRKKDEPFFFWYGGNEPHRIYEEGSGKKAGMDLRRSFVPGFLPDDSVVRSDIADYDLEIGWFDSQLAKMIQFLKDKGELDNTLIVVTSDNGMPFPSAKANLTEYGSHVPLAICWPDRIAAGGVSNDLVSLVDLAPTFLHIAGVDTVAGMAGRGLGDVLFRVGRAVSAVPGVTAVSAVPAVAHRSYVLTGRERHSDSRPDDLGYPSRAIRTDSLLYILNFKPGLWPAGDPPPGGIRAALAGAVRAGGAGGGEEGGSGKGGKGAGMGAGAGGDFKAIGLGYGDIDDPSPTKVFLMKHRKEFPALFRDGYEKRPAEQLFDIRNDPGCTKNLLEGKTKERYAGVGRVMKDSLLRLLREQGDPRVTGHGDVFDSYPRFGLMRNWPGFKERGKYNPAYMNKQDVAAGGGPEHPLNVPVIIIISDQLRYDAIGKHTPNIDRLRADGVSFERAYCASPICVPSRAAFFTGRYPNRNGCLINGWEGDERRLGEVRSGIPNLYTTMEKYWDSRHVGKQHFFTQDKIDADGRTRTKWITQATYKDWLKANGVKAPGGRQFTAMAPELVSGGHTHTKRYTLPVYEAYQPGVAWFGDDYFANRAVGIIDSAGTGRPLLLNLMFLSPHPPYNIPEPYYSKYSTRDFEIPDNVGAWYEGQSPLQLYNLPGFMGSRYSRQDWERIWPKYFGLVSLVDDEVGKVIAALKKKGLYDKALIVFTADHGEMLGAHSLWQKMCMYEEAAHVPLIIKFPSGVGSVSRRVDSLVSLIDVWPTLMDYLHIPADDSVDGLSLMPLLQGENWKRDDVFIQYDGNGGYGNNQRCVVRGQYKLIIDTYKNEDFLELYDVLKDPEEKENLALRTEYAGKTKELIGVLRKHMRDTNDMLSVPASVYEDFQANYAKKQRKGGEGE